MFSDLLLLNVITPVPGYQTKEQILPMLKYVAEGAYKTKTLDTFLKDTIH